MVKKQTITPEEPAVRGSGTALPVKNLCELRLGGSWRQVNMSTQDHYKMYTLLFSIEARS